MAKFFRSARPTQTIQPRSSSEGDIRSMTTGPILPMKGPGFFARLFGRG